MVPDTRQRLAAIVADTRKLLVRDRVGFFLSSFSSPPFLGTTLSLSCPVSHMISEQRKPI